MRGRTVERDQRTLLLLSASAAGGKAAEKVWRMLDRERKELAGDASAKQEAESGTPLCQEDFERMLREDED